jgi:hypothetical protein
MPPSFRLRGTCPSRESSRIGYRNLVLSWKIENLARLEAWPATHRNTRLDAFNGITSARAVSINRIASAIGRTQIATCTALQDTGRSPANSAIKRAGNPRLCSPRLLGIRRKPRIQRGSLGAAWRSPAKRLRMVKRRARARRRRLSLQFEWHGSGRRLVWVLCSAGWAELLSLGEEWFDSLVSESENRTATANGAPKLVPMERGVRASSVKIERVDGVRHLNCLISAKIAYYPKFNSLLGLWNSLLRCAGNLPFNILALLVNSAALAVHERQTQTNSLYFPS